MQPCVATAKFAEKPSSICGEYFCSKNPRLDALNDPEDNARPLPPALVLDTNAVLDAWVFHDPCMAAVLQSLSRGDTRMMASPSMRDELAHTLKRASLQRWSPDETSVLAQFDARATLCPEPAQPAVPGLWCTDNDDQVFLDLALAQRARWLLTKDRALLRLARKARVWGVAIVQPGQWP